MNANPAITHPSSQQLVIFRMCSHPNPKKTTLNRRSESTVIHTDTNRPQLPHFFKLQRGMIRISLQQTKILVRKFANIKRKPVRSRPGKTPKLYASKVARRAGLVFNQFPPQSKSYP
jgi:hypothetical protein